MPWIFNPFTANFDFYLIGSIITGPPVVGKLLVGTGEFLSLDSGGSLLL